MQVPDWLSFVSEVTEFFPGFEDLERGLTDEIIGFFAFIFTCTTAESVADLSLLFRGFAVRLCNSTLPAVFDLVVLIVQSKC